MIKFNGIFQLVKVVKEDKTKKGNTKVLFTAASNRGEETDFKLFAMYSNNADYFIRNLTKDNDGKYMSRKMYIEGYIRTFNEQQDVTCTAEITTDMLPAEIGYLKQNVTVNASTNIKIQRDILEVQSFEFVDKSKDSKISILVNNEVVDTNSNTNSNNINDTDKGGGSFGGSSVADLNDINDAFKMPENLCI